MKVLLIDDDKDDQAIFMEAVSQLTVDIQCETADDGIQGLRHLITNEDLPDVLFLDINMPRMNGKETLLAIRSIPKLDRIAIVIYSTSCHERDAQWASELNARYLVKPNNFASLLSSLSSALSEMITENNKQLTRHTC